MSDSSLAIRALAVVAIVAVLGVTLSDWTGGGIELSAWNDFTAALGADPFGSLGDFPESPTASSQTGRRYYFRSEAGFPCPPGPPAALAMGGNPVTGGNVSIADGRTWQLSLAAATSWETGAWTFLLYLAVGTSGSGDASVRVTWGVTDEGTCATEQKAALLSDALAAGAVQAISLSIVVNRFDALATDSIQVDITRETSTRPVYLLMDTLADRASQMRTPAVVASDPLSQIAEVFSTIGAWFGFVLAAIAWLFLAFVGVLVWFATVVVTFFVTLFALGSFVLTLGGTAPPEVSAILTGVSVLFGAVVLLLVVRTLRGVN